MSYLPDLVKLDKSVADIGTPRQVFVRKNSRLLAGVAMAALLALGYGGWRSESAGADTTAASAAGPLTGGTTPGRNVRPWSAFSRRLAAGQSAQISPPGRGPTTQN